jgi:hypothetical protein
MLLCTPATPRGSPLSVLGSYSHCPPTLLLCSMTVTSWPSRRSSRAHAKPEMPAPTTHTFLDETIVAPPVDMMDLLHTRLF